MARSAKGFRKHDVRHIPITAREMASLSSESRFLVAFLEKHAPNRSELMSVDGALHMARIILAWQEVKP